MTKPYNPRRFTPYMKKPRSWRRDRFVSLRWKIAQDPNGRGVFTSMHMMDGGVYEGVVYQGVGDSHWNDFRFLSRKHARQGLVYTGTVRTALMAAVDWAENYAWDKEQETLTPEEHDAAHPPLEFVPCGRGFYTMKEHAEPLFDRLGGISAWGLRAKFLREALTQIPGIHPSCRFDRAYSTGLGAIFITAAPKITMDSIAALIEDFWARGEVAYEDEAIDFTDHKQVNNTALHTMIDEMAKGWERMDMLARGELVEDTKAE